MSTYEVREGLRDALMVASVFMLLWVGAQLTTINRVLALRFTQSIEPLETTFRSPDGAMSTRISTPREPEETEVSHKERHWRMVKLLQHMYPEMRPRDADDHDDVGERR